MIYKRTIKTMSEMITAGRAQFNWEKALQMEASVKNPDDKEYWRKQAESWLELYTKISNRDKASTKAALTSFSSAQIHYNSYINGILKKT